MATHEYLTTFDPGTDTESDGAAEIAEGEDYHSMLTMVGQSERHTREEANWYLYVHFAMRKDAGDTSQGDLHESN
eukprot:12025693-Prorocentrum_lima.AAC.1